MGKLKFSREFKIGFFGILMLACLYWGINFLKGTDLLTRTTKYYAVYEQINGLQSSASIVIKGFKVGTVSNMTYDPKKSDNVILEFSIRDKYDIPVNSTARIFSDGLMGGKAVEIQLGNATDHLLEGDTLFSIADKDFLEVAGGEFEFLKQRLNDVVIRAVATLESLDKILTDNSQSITTTMSNLASITGHIDTIVDEEGGIRGIVTNLNGLSKTLKEKSDNIGNIVDNVERFTDSLSAAQIPTLVTEITYTLQSLNETLDKVNGGEGTVGKLIADEQLYDSLVETVGNLSAVLEDLKANPRKYINLSIF